MQKVNNWESVQVAEQGGGNSLPAGGYVCKILRVENDETKQYLKIEFDIAEGDYKGYFAKLNETKKKWLGNYYRTYDEKSASYFKGFITAIERSNANYKWDWNEHSLLGKYLGIVFGFEEYLDKEHTIKQTLRARYIHSVEIIKKGEWKIPSVKRISLAIPQQPVNPIYQVYETKKEEKQEIVIADGDLPF